MNRKALIAVILVCSGLALALFILYSQNSSGQATLEIRAGEMARTEDEPEH